KTPDGLGDPQPVHPEGEPPPRAGKGLAQGWKLGRDGSPAADDPDLRCQPGGMEAVTDGRLEHRGQTWEHGRALRRPRTSRPWASHVSELPDRLQRLAARLDDLLRLAARAPGELVPPAAHHLEAGVDAPGEPHQ